MGSFDNAGFAIDEQQREKSSDILACPTTAGILQKFSEQAEFRQLLDTFHHRPPNRPVGLLRK